MHAQVNKVVHKNYISKLSYLFKRGPGKLQLIYKTIYVSTSSLDLLAKVRDCVALGSPTQKKDAHLTISKYMQTCVYIEGGLALDENRSAACLYPTKIDIIPYKICSQRYHFILGPLNIYSLDPKISVVPAFREIKRF
jgi:hypothetical protein